MSHHTKEFFDFIRAIGECKSKQEEDKIVLREIANLKTHLNKSKISMKLMREYIVRSLYCEMLGHNASFSYIHAIKLSASTKIIEKRCGYLGVTLFLPNNDSLILLMISTIQNDLQSTNYIQICAALTAANKIANKETIPAILPLLQKLKKHKMPSVRKKTFILYHTFYQINNESVPNIIEIAKEGLVDEDPSVMNATLTLFIELLKDEKICSQFKQFTGSFINIFHQILDHKLSTDYDYHRLPAPWTQINLLQIIGLLGKDDKKTSKIMYDTIKNVIQRADIGLNIGNSIIYEAIKCITTIYPNQELLNISFQIISRFLTSTNNNLKYLGIRLLNLLVKIDTSYATKHQMTVIDCLENPDKTISRETLTLLVTMTTEKNVKVIIKKLIDFAKKTVDNHIRKELIENITKISEKFAPDTYWYVDTMETLLDFAPTFVPDQAIQNLLTVIAEGSGSEDEEEDQKIRVYCVDKFYETLEDKVVQDNYLQVIVWILGEYGYLSEKYSKEDIIDRLSDVIERHLEHNETRSWIISALLKLVVQLLNDDDYIDSLDLDDDEKYDNFKKLPISLQDIFMKYKASKDLGLQQRCVEFLNLIKVVKTNQLPIIIPKDGSCEDIEVDEDLTFLDDFVNESKRQGHIDYISDEEKRGEIGEIIQKEKVELKISEYEKPKTMKKFERFQKNYHQNQQNPQEQNNLEYASETKVDYSIPDKTFYPKKMNEEQEINFANLSQNKKKNWVLDESDDENELNQIGEKKNTGDNENEDEDDFSKLSQKKFQRINQQNQVYKPQNQTNTINNTYKVPEEVEEEKKISSKNKKFLNDVFGGSGSTKKKKVKKKKIKKSKKKNSKVVKNNEGNLFNENVEINNDNNNNNNNNNNLLFQMDGGEINQNQNQNQNQKKGDQLDDILGINNTSNQKPSQLIDFNNL